MARTPIIGYGPDKESYSQKEDPKTFQWGTGNFPVECYQKSKVSIIYNFLCQAIAILGLFITRISM